MRKNVVTCENSSIPLVNDEHKYIQILKPVDYYAATSGRGLGFSSCKHAETQHQITILQA